MGSVTAGYRYTPQVLSERERIQKLYDLLSNPAADQPEPSKAEITTLFRAGIDLMLDSWEKE